MITKGHGYGRGATALGSLEVKTQIRSSGMLAEYVLKKGVPGEQSWSGVLLRFSFRQAKGNLRVTSDHEAIAEDTGGATQDDASPEEVLASGRGLRCEWHCRKRIQYVGLGGAIHSMIP